MPKYRVATEDGFSEFRWPWQARKCLRQVELGPGQCALLFKEYAGGYQACLKERLGPTLPMAAQSKVRS